MLNPLAVAVQEIRHSVIDPTAPSAAAVLGSRAALLIPLGIAVGVVLLSVWVYRRAAHRLAEDL